MHKSKTSYFRRSKKPANTMLANHFRCTGHLEPSSAVRGAREVARQRTPRGETGVVREARRATCVLWRSDGDPDAHQPHQPRSIHVHFCSPSAGGTRRKVDSDSSARAAEAAGKGSLSRPAPRASHRPSFSTRRSSSASWRMASRISTQSWPSVASGWSCACCVSKADHSCIASRVASSWR